MAAWLDYDQHARNCARDDLWGQVRRTVRGRAVDADQIDLIVAAIRRQLRLRPRDTLLDLACGNGALTARLQEHCAESLCVDVSEYLIAIAQESFGTARHEFLARDAATFVEQARAPERFTKALCYGSLGYLDDDQVARMLRALHARFRSVSRVMLGNLADPGRLASFYGPGPWPPLDEPRSDIGVWRDLDRITTLAGPGWRIRASIMPATFFGAHYRFDAVLERAS